MKFLILVLLAGCTQANPAKRMNTEAHVWSQCIDNVLYYVIYQNAIAPAYNTDGTIKTCGEVK